MNPYVFLVLSLCPLTLFGQSPSDLRGDFDSEMAQLEDAFQLVFHDAVTGKPIKGGQVLFNGVKRTTDTQGAVRFDMPLDLQDDEKRAFVFSKPGYVKSKLHVHFMVGAVFFNRFSISPGLPPGRIRIVLDWGAAPTDLDAHLVKDGVYHLSYRQMRKYQDRAWLDRDDRDGHGPETITVLSLDPEANYRFYVHDYTRSGAIGKSRAHIRVYSSEGVERSFTVSPGTKGDTWRVFNIKRGAIHVASEAK